MGEGKEPINKDEFVMKVVLSVVLAVLLCRWVFLVFKFIHEAVKGPKDTQSELNEAKSSNPFLKQKKDKPTRMPKPTSGVKYLYRLARASEPGRKGRKGEQEQGVAVGVEARAMARTPMMLRMSEGGYYGVNGLDTDCLHLSTAAQVKETAELYFGGIDDLILLKFSTATIEKDENVELRWESALPQPGAPARTDAFPHVYSEEKGAKARLSWWDLADVIELPLGADGERVFPKHALSEDDEAAPPGSFASAVRPGDEADKAAALALIAAAKEREEAAKKEAVKEADKEENDLDAIEEELRREMLGEKAG
jgi:uncharacterized protein (DUF952 family)